MNSSKGTTLPHCTPRCTAAPAHQLPVLHPSSFTKPITDILEMDFFFSLFAPATAETRAELDDEVEQVPVDFEGGSGPTQGCVVA